MTKIVPTVGRVVLYRLSSADIRMIDKSHGFKPGNDYREGDILPAIVVRTWGSTPESAVNLSVLLDGVGTYWATSRVVGDAPGQYHWMAYQQGQAAKTEAAERALASGVGRPGGKPNAPGAPTVATSAGDHV